MHSIETFIATLVPGQLCNVESNPDRAPCMRVVSKVERRTRQGQQWLYWFWVPGADLSPRDNVTTRGFADCGYSAVAI